MTRGSGFRSGQERIILIVGWVVVVVIGVGLIWLGYALGKRQPPTDTRPSTAASAVPTVFSPLPATTVVSPIIPTPVPTVTPLPEAMPTPIPVPATPTPLLSPMATAGEGGANVRSGPGTNFTKVGYLDPGAQVPIIGRYADWWQIDYNGVAAWAYSDVVTASNAEDVPEVQPPPSPTPPPPPPATVAPTSPPPAQSQLPGLSANLHGLVASGYQVEGAPGPYNAGKCIWFNMKIDNNSSEEIKYDALGTWVYETGQFQKSYFSTPPNYPSFLPGQKFSHRDCIRIPSPGTYNLYLAIHFKGGEAALMKGPVTVTVQ